MVIFAHPDEGEIYAGGITALYTQLGHEVKFMSLTNGDAGHYAMKPDGEINPCRVRVPGNSIYIGAYRGFIRFS